MSNYAHLAPDLLLVKASGSFESSSFIAYKACRKSNNVFSVPLFAGEHASIGTSSVMILTKALICGCGRYKEVSVDAYPGTKAVSSMTRFFRCGECGKRATAARPGRLHRGAAGSMTINILSVRRRERWPSAELCSAARADQIRRQIAANPAHTFGR